MDLEQLTTDFANLENQVEATFYQILKNKSYFNMLEEKVPQNLALPEMIEYAEDNRLLRTLPVVTFHDPKENWSFSGYVVTVSLHQLKVIDVEAGMEYDNVSFSNIYSVKDKLKVLTEMSRILLYSC